MAERFTNCLIGLIVGRVLRDKHKRWRLDRDNYRKLEAQSRGGTRPTPTTAHAAAVQTRSQRPAHGQTGSSPLQSDSISGHCGAAMPPGLGLALPPMLDLVPVAAEVPEPSSTSGTATSPMLAPEQLSSVASGPLPSAVSGPACPSARTGLALVPAIPSSSNPSAKAQILMPNRHYLNVHSHYAKVPVHVELNEANDKIKISGVMQSYDYGCLAINRHIGFKLHRSKGKARMPARKAVDLEKLPPLSSALAKEITHTKQVHEQAAVFAKIRSEREEYTELQRRANRAPQHQVPSFKMQIGPLYIRKGSRSDAPTPPVTPAGSPANRSQSNPQPSKGLPTCDAPQETHVRWVPNLIQQQQKHSYISQRRHRPQPIAYGSKAKSALRKVTIGPMGR